VQTCVILHKRLDRQHCPVLPVFFKCEEPDAALAFIRFTELDFVRLLRTTAVTEIDRIILTKNAKPHCNKWQDKAHPFHRVYTYLPPAPVARVSSGVKKGDQVGVLLQITGKKFVLPVSAGCGVGDGCKRSPTPLTAFIHQAV
jgi:hypothetical protein